MPRTSQVDGVYRAIAAHVTHQLKLQIPEEGAYKALVWYSRFLPDEFQGDYGTLVFIELSEAKYQEGNVNEDLFRRICNRVAKRLTYAAKRAAREIPYEGEEVAGDSGENTVRAIAVKEALLAMAPDDQMLLLLHFIQGRSLQEIAADFEIPLSTLHRKIKSALRTARDLLESSPDLRTPTRNL